MRYYKLSVYSWSLISAPVCLCLHSLVLFNCPHINIPGCVFWTNYLDAHACTRMRTLWSVHRNILVVHLNYIISYCFMKNSILNFIKAKNNFYTSQWDCIIIFQYLSNNCIIWTNDRRCNYSITNDIFTKHSHNKYRFLLSYSSNIVHG